MRAYSKQQQSEIEISLEAFGLLKMQGRVSLTPAFVHQIDGPHYWDVIWVLPHARDARGLPRPYISSNYTNAQITRVLAEEFV